MAKINYSAAELDAAIAASETVSTAMSGVLPVTFARSSGNYCIFARIHHSTWGSANHFSALLSGGGSYSNVAYGLFWVDGQCRSGNINMTAKQVIAPGSGTPVFGHYDGGDGFEYFGVKRGTAKIVVWPLQVDYNDNTADFGNHYMSDTQPTGWTTISTS